MKVVNKNFNNVKRKGFLALISGIVLVVLVIGVTFAWYTKMTSISGIRLDVAKWEFNANSSTSDFSVNVYSYQTIENKYAAPGTWGFLKMYLSPGQSQTDINYTFMVDKESMSEEFKDRIYFYYCTGNKSPSSADYNDGTSQATISDNKISVSNLLEFSEENYVSGVLKRNASSNVYIYWHWIYDFDEYLTLGENGKDVYCPIYSQILGESITESNKALFESLYTFMDENVTDDVIEDFNEYMEDNPMGADITEENKDLYIIDIFNEVILDSANQITSGDYQNKKTYYKYLFEILENYEVLEEKLDELREKFDDFDLSVGKNPALYKEYMTAQLSIVGVEAEPVLV